MDAPQLLEAHAEEARQVRYGVMSQRLDILLLGGRLAGLSASKACALGSYVTYLYGSTDPEFCMHIQLQVSTNSSIHVYCRLLGQAGCHCTQYNCFQGYLFPPKQQQKKRGQNCYMHILSGRSFPSIFISFAYYEVVITLSSTGVGREKAKETTVVLL